MNFEVKQMRYHRILFALLGFLLGIMIGEAIVRHERKTVTAPTFAPCMSYVDANGKESPCVPVQ